MSLTTDPNDPNLCYGIDEKPREQCDVYLVLSEEERKKGFVRPLRTSYIHIGNKKRICGKFFSKSEEGIYRCNEDFGHDDGCHRGRLEASLSYEGDSWFEGKEGCGTITTMNRAIAETYARNPKYYGATYCCYCRMHLSVKEFIWEGTNEVVGS